jgi:hypothetical protein
MVAYPDELLSPNDRWALVHYIQSLRRKDVEINDILAPENGIVPVHRRHSPLPLDPAHPQWERIESTPVPLDPLWPEPFPINAVAVRAIHDGQQIALLLQWRDDRFDGAPVRVQDFQDAAALQFSLTGAFPFLGMGDSDNPVNVWQWKAGWQQTTDGTRPDVETLYASMHVDIPSNRSANPLYFTADAAGNLLAAANLVSPIEDANARGFGTMASQPLAAQNVRGNGLWRDDFWSVLFVRNLRSPDADDVQFIPGGTVPVAFAIWNGAQRDRNGRKVISHWFQLQLEE